MSEKIEAIKQKLDEMATGIEQVFPAVVKEVDETEFTCVVEISKEIQFTQVRLRSIIDTEKKGFCFIPTVESIVLVSRIANSNILFVSLFSEIDKILFTYLEDAEMSFDTERLYLRVKERSIEINEDAITFNNNDKGSYATDINSLVSKINGLEDELNSLKQVFTTWVPAPMDGGAVLKAAVTNWASQLIAPKTTVNDIKDELIKH